MNKTRNPEITARESEILRLIGIWRSRSLDYEEISERLSEKGYTVSEALARKMYERSNKTAQKCAQ